MERARRVGVISGGSSGIGVAPAEVILMEGRAAALLNSQRLHLQKMWEAPQSVSAEALGDGRFVPEGPYLKNEPAELGKTAVHRSDQPHHVHNERTWLHPGSSRVPQLGIALAGQISGHRGGSQT
ncbi:hypothetical protein GA0061098_1009198 [Bradyrhizobium shewense]|uniref:Uncharacterized protein n=1 Tax=Bradyrhizobium shewense TaxID=1761772 RepID=A0A1C3WSR3_9BRAD|nr:hypothetical protein [Bradyrhizobium shewense]SCB42906.1 hypothetical protein GA0061098_1009198 [Bradyrhizobium shewense]